MTFTEKMDIITSILNSLKSSSGFRFEAKMRRALQRYYKHTGKVFLTHGSSGGDFGNDGWIENESLFYQFHAPRVGGSKSKIHEKYKDDLNKLLNAVVKGGKYKGKISKYVFIVNTMDEDLPADPDDFIGLASKELCEKYSITVECAFASVEYIRDLLESVDDEKVLKGIAYDVNAPVINGLNEFELQTNDILEFLDSMLEKLGGADSSVPQSLKKISLPYKIEINELQSIEDNINSIFVKIGVVDKARGILDDPIPRMGAVISHYVKVYQDAIAGNMSKIDIYSHIIKSIMDVVGKDFEAHIEYVLVYIMDRCDIFEKVRR